MTAGEGELLYDTEIDLREYFRFDTDEDAFIRVTAVDAAGNEAYTGGYSRRETE